MEPIDVVAPILATAESFQRALTTVDFSSISRENLRMLHQFAVYINILEESMDLVQAEPESRLTRAILEAASECEDSCHQLAYRLERLDGSTRTKGVSYLLAPWEKLHALLKKFQEDVELVRSLTQSLMLQKLVKGTNQSLDVTQWQAMLNEMFEQRRAPNRSLFLSDMSNGTDSTLPGRSSFVTTTGIGSLEDVVSLADQVVSRSIARGVNFDPDPTLTIGNIFVTHEDRPRFVPVRAKYDTGSDVNFIPSAFVETHGLTPLLVELDNTDSDDNVFIGLNNQEYRVRYSISLEWCSSGMQRVRTTLFHLADDIPFDLLLGNSFIQDNRIFVPPKMALHLRRKRKHRTSAERAEEERKNAEHESAAAQEQKRARDEDKRKRELEREARRLAKSQSSASTMLSPSATLSTLTM